MIDIPPQHLKTVRDILLAHVPLCEVRAFGSRVGGVPKPYSDLDLAVLGLDKYPAHTLSNLKEAFAESDLPFRVDLLNWEEAPDGFKKTISRGYEMVRPAA
jgi:predicted nucleotidyltransferase